MTAVKAFNLRTRVETTLETQVKMGGTAFFSYFYGKLLLIIKENNYEQYFSN